MKLVHFCAGLDHWNGMANTARQFVARETAEGQDSQLTNRLEDICAGVDQVVIHGAWLPAVHRAAKRAKAVGARLVIRPAGSYDPVRLRYHAWKKRLCAFWERQMLRQADVVWATCKEEAQWIHDYCGGVKVEEIDLKAFFKIPAVVPPVWCEGGRPLRVLYLGRKHPLKGIAYLERAVAELQGQGASVELKVVSDAFDDALEQVWQWADVLCLPTLSENFGRVVAEALERDKFVVTTDGAPVWVDLKPEQGVYLKGFRDGDDATRVELLRFGLKGLATGRLRTLRAPVATETEGVLLRGASRRSRPAVCPPRLPVIRKATALPPRRPICYTSHMQSIKNSVDRREVAAAGHFRRLKTYDYARGAVLFVSFGVVGRRRVFGSIDSVGTLTHSPAGLAAVETLRREAARGTGVELKRFVIMPDHVHLRLYIRPGLTKPLALLPNFIRNFKRWSQYRARQLGVDFEWEEGYHDRLCLSREVIDIVDKYIDNNALKWALMHGTPPPLKVIEPFEAPCLPDDEWWSAVGAVELMSDVSRLCAVRLSRHLPVARYTAVVAELVVEARRGTVFIGTFISPCERKLAEALVREGLPMIRVVPDPLALVYRPKGDEPQQFAAGRLLLLSRVVGSLRPEGPRDRTGSLRPEGPRDRTGSLRPEGPRDRTGSLRPEGPRDRTGSLRPEGPRDRTGSLRPEGPRDRTPVGRCGHAVGTGREEAWHGINDVLAYLFPRSLYIDH